VTAAARRARLLVSQEDAGAIEGLVARFGLLVGGSGGDPAPAAVGILDPESLDDPAGTDALFAETADGAVPWVVLTGPRERSDLARFVASPAVCAIVPREGPRRDHELAEALTSILEGPEIAAPMLPAITDELELPLASSQDREPALDRLAGFFSEAGIRRRVTELAVDGAEELITNALYDAPTDSAGRRLYAEIDRRHAVFLGDGSRPRLRAAVGADALAVGVLDPFGSLEIAEVRRFLCRVLGGGEQLDDAKRGGAGLGLARVFAMVDRLAVKVRRGRAAEVGFWIASAGARRGASAQVTGLLLADDRLNPAGAR